MKTIEDPEVIQAFEKRLRNELEETIRLIEESREHRAPVALDQQSVGRLSRMDAMQQQAMAQDITRRRQQRKIAIERALSRIRDGEFGYCVKCEEPITVRRLDIDPTFEACVRCAP
ncbi:conjugal transfer protein TraR [Phyllobacterium phragmitis]|uniref:Conjugal transfer protein TraR n=1 Tax=Phyllobacterium phragmitis TaxID=2670329 RepID=A0A2S9IPY2_9HYPH|nr:conjugal transfer protein TraR [Phyllobacterium phragmitis]PRD42591.1 conjugal transfer protein TraR [Phyllobacterium phragmitis]